MSTGGGAGSASSAGGRRNTSCFSSVRLPLFSNDFTVAMELSLINISYGYTTNTVDGMDCCTTMLCLNCLCGGCN